MAVRKTTPAPHFAEGSLSEPEYISLNRRAYDALSEQYARRAVHKSVFEMSPATLAGVMIRAIKTREQAASILEIGPGSGETLAYLETAGYGTVAVELSPRIAVVARRRSPRSIVIVGNVLAADFHPRQFHGVYAGAVIHLFPLEDARRLLTKIHAWLRPDGILLINTTVHEHSEEGFYKKTDYGDFVRFRRKWTEADFRMEIQRAGFCVRKRIMSHEQDREKVWVAFICRKLKA